MNEASSREQTLQEYIQAANRDISYCESELTKLDAMLGDTVNAGYAAKEIDKTRAIIASHQARKEKYLQELSSISATASAVAAPEQTEPDKLQIAAANLENAKAAHANRLAENEKLLDEYTAGIGGFSAANFRLIHLKRKELEQLAATTRKALMDCEDRFSQAQSQAHAAKFTGTKFEKCTRCAGSGSTIHTHVKYGECFKCNGTGQQRTRAFNQHMQEIEGTKDDLPY